VTVTKYRADLLTDEIAERVGEIASDISEDFGVNIQNVNGGSDHVHILFTAKPTTDLTKFINSLKGVTSRKIRDENPRFGRRSTKRSGNRDTSSPPLAK